MWSVRQQRFSVGMTPTVATSLAVSPQEAEQCYRHDPLIVEEQFTHG